MVIMPSIPNLGYFLSTNSKRDSIKFMELAKKGAYILVNIQYYQMKWRGTLIDASCNQIK